MKSFNYLTMIATIFGAGKVLGDCFSTKLGYPCCQSTNQVIYTDSDGNWGVENNNWCGLVSESSNYCWSKALGYPCCSSSTTVYYSDNDGDWSIENGDWCGINKSDSSSPQPQPTQDDNMLEVAINYMNKLNVVNPIPSSANAKANGVTTVKKTYNSKTTGTTRNVNIVFPPNYSENKKYPVLYFLHGIFGSEDDLLGESFGTKNIPANLVQQGKAKEMIIVLPNTYAPAPGTSAKPSFSQDYFDGYDNFINDLINDLMPFIENNYPVLTGRENTAIAGFSMGGRNSLYIGYSRPDLFGYVGAFSPAPGVTPGSDTFSGQHKGLFQESEFKIKEPSKYTPYVTLISCGTKDSIVGTFPKSYHEILTRNEQPHIWFEIQGADHDGVAVSNGLYNFVSTLFGTLN